MVNPGRDFPITCRCMRTKIGIKCKFNESPVLCQRLGLGVANPDGKFGLRFQKISEFNSLRKTFKITTKSNKFHQKKLLIAPTVEATTVSGRAVFYPGGKKPTKPSNTRPPVNIGGQGSSCEEKNHSFEMITT